MSGVITAKECAKYRRFIIAKWGAAFYQSCMLASGKKTFLALLVEHGKI